MIARALGLLGLALLSAAAPARPDAADRDGLSRFRLPNGFQVVVARRPGLRLAAVNLTVAVGAADDPQGLSGMAHVLEHVTLSGTLKVGSLDPAREAEALDRVDRAWRGLAEAGEERERAWREAEAAADALAEPGEVYGVRLEQRGAIGLNAVTGQETTQFFCRLPLRELDTWMALEADRLRNPLFRHFYREREVVLQEIRQLTGGRPTVRELFLRRALPDVRQGPVHGRLDEVESIDRPAALEYFRAAYRPARMALAVVGDVDPAEVRRLAERHFGALPGDPAAPTAAPAVQGPEEPRSATFNAGGTPVAYLGFPRPAGFDPALEALAELINHNDLSPVAARLMAKDFAWRVGAEASTAGPHMPALFVVFAYGRPGLRAETLEGELEQAVRELSKAAPEDLEGGALQAAARLAGQLADPASLAALLARDQVIEGDAGLAFRRLEALRALTADDLRSAARRLAPPPSPPGEAAAPAEGSR